MNPFRPLLRFDIVAKDCMVWRPSNIQLRNLKHKNVASYFSAAAIRDSPACDQACGWLISSFVFSAWQIWRMRMYPVEKILGAAKPLVFLKAKLALGEGQAQRIL